MKKEPTVSVWNEFWNRKKDLDKVYPSSPAVQKALFSLFSLDSIKELRVLEVGAGSGRDSLALAKAGAQVFVLDYSEKALNITSGIRSEASENLHLVRGDAFNAPFPDGSFDIVFHQGLAEHFREPLPLIRENHRLLKKGGFCLCDVPQTFHPYTIVKHILIFMNKWFAGWETEFTMPQLKNLMKASGFEIEFGYGDWMRPNFFYRVLREIGFKFKVELPKYPLDGSLYQKAKDRLLDVLTCFGVMRYTQLNIGIVGRKL